MKTILFDMDGTLLDTEKYYQQFWHQACADFGLTLSKEDGLGFRSLGRPLAQPNFRRIFGEAADYTAVRQRRMDLMNEFFKDHEIPLKPYAAETLTELRRRGYRVAVVTASNKSRADKYLTDTGIHHNFDDIICATMVEQGKPAPDVYLYACQQMSVDPAETYAVEDSPNGVRSAYSAGCKVIMIPDLSQPDEETAKLPYRKADNLKELLEIL